MRYHLKVPEIVNVLVFLALGSGQLHHGADFQVAIDSLWEIVPHRRGAIFFPRLALEPHFQSSKHFAFRTRLIGVPIGIIRLSEGNVFAVS